MEEKSHLAGRILNRLEQLPFTAAASSVVRDGRTFYFCSEHCKESFVKGNN